MKFSKYLFPTKALLIYLNLKTQDILNLPKLQVEQNVTVS